MGSSPQGVIHIPQRGGDTRGLRRISCAAIWKNRRDAARNTSLAEELQHVRLPEFEHLESCRAGIVGSTYRASGHDVDRYSLMQLAYANRRLPRDVPGIYCIRAIYVGKIAALRTNGHLAYALWRRPQRNHFN